MASRNTDTSCRRDTSVRSHERDVWPAADERLKDGEKVTHDGVKAAWGVGSESVKQVLEAMMVVMVMWWRPFLVVPRHFDEHWQVSQLLVSQFHHASCLQRQNNSHKRIGTLKDIGALSAGTGGGHVIILLPHVMKVYHLRGSQHWVEENTSFPG